MKKTTIILLLLLLSIQFVGNWQSAAKTDTQSLMIVAHPDDETIWGGTHLEKGNFFVVCLTNSNNEKRKREFYSVLKKANVKGEILNFPDKTNGVRDDWIKSETQIKKELRKIINQQDWDLIVTHNPLGEYGHLHHKKTSRFVTEIIKENKQIDKLYYFGKYYKKKEVDTLAGKVKGLKHALNQEELDKKKTMLDIYLSQQKVVKHLGHMISYENWIPYQKWK